MTTPTPRTDELEKRWNRQFVPLTQEGIDLCRTLELELAEAKREIAHLVDMGVEFAQAVLDGCLRSKERARELLKTLPK